MEPEDYTTLKCPLCFDPTTLHVVHESTTPLYRDADVNEEDARYFENDPYTMTYRVECENGHVVFRPGDLDPEIDPSADYNYFRVADLNQIKVVLDSWSNRG